MANFDVVNYMMTDSQGNIWVGDNSSVKCYYAAGEIQGSNFSSKEWKIGGKVSTMCDVDGKIWVVTGNECCVISREGESMRFVIPTITPFTIYYSKSTHEVVMGGNDGFVEICSDAILSPKKLNQLILAGIVVNGKPWDERSEKLVLKSDENSFILQLTDLPFADHPSAVYAYRLEGSDHDWNYLKSGDIDIVYNGLSYGNYHLSVCVVNGEGKIGAEVYSQDISVLPPWYLTIWAKLFYITALIVLISWVVSYYFLHKKLAEEQKQKAEILDQVQMRMDFFARLTEGLKAAVAHQSFDEVNELMSRFLDVKLPLGNSSSSVGGQIEKPSQSVADGDVNGKQSEAVVPELSEADRHLLDEINRAIEEHMIDSDFNVTMLQEVMSMGNKQLYRKVKALTGSTPVEYIRDLRMHKAAKLLSAGKFSVSEVMYTVGFSNSSYFSKCFSKAFGMTPTEYMKQK